MTTTPTPTATVIPVRPSRIARAAGTLLAAALLSTTACGGDSATGPSARPVAPAVVARVVIAPKAVMVLEGESAPFTATAYDAAGTVLAQPVAVRSLAPELAVVSGSAVRMRSTGTAQVVASAGDRTDTLVVTAIPAAATLRLATTDLLLAQGDTLRLGGEVRGANGDVLTGRTVTYRSENPAIATVDATGRVIAGQTIGQTRIIATVERVTRTMNVSVRSNATGDFHITLRFIGAVDTTMQRLAREGARRWEQVIRGALPAQTLATTTAACGLPPVNETVDHVLIYVAVRTLDGRGGAYGIGGPCLVRAGSRLPVLASITLDAADLDAMLADAGQAARVIQHEMGHALGFGTTWQVAGEPTLADLLAGRGTTDPRFSGHGAVQAATALGFAASGGVAVEGPGGSADTHWRYTTPLGQVDLMAPAGGLGLITRVTVAAMADLGYTVSMDGADPYDPALVASGASASMRATTAPSLTAAPAHPDHARPAFVVTPSGALRQMPGAR